MALNLGQRQRQRRGLFLRYVHHVERTGLSLHPALEQRLCSFLEAHAQEAADLLPDPHESLAAPAPALAAADAGRLLSPAPPELPTSAPALPVAPQAFDPPVATASASGPVITVNNLISSPPAPAEPMRRTVDTLAVDPELSDLQHEAATGMELMLGRTMPPLGVSATPGDPMRLALLRTVQQIRRSGRCDHPALNARITALHQVPHALRGNETGALESALASSQQLLGKLQDQLLGELQDPLLPIDAPVAPSQVSIAGVAIQLRHCRHHLADLLNSFGTELHAPLQAMIRRQLRRARRLDWRLRLALLARREEQILAPLALTLVQVLQSVVGLWRGGTGQEATALPTAPPVLV